MRALLLLLALGCSDPGALNACSDSALIGERCVTFHLVAEPALVDAQLTSVRLWVRYLESGVERVVQLDSPMRTPTKFPAAVGLHLPQLLQGAAQVSILAMVGPGTVGYSFVSVSPASGQHLDQEVMMQRPELSGCFDGHFTSAAVETGIDCGNRCPPCDPGQACANSGDCKSASCSGGTNLCD